METIEEKIISRINPFYFDIITDINSMEKLLNITPSNVKASELNQVKFNFDLLFLKKYMNIMISQLWHMKYIFVI